VSCKSPQAGEDLCFPIVKYSSEQVFSRIRARTWKEKQSAIVDEQEEVRDISRYKKAGLERGGEGSGRVRVGGGGGGGGGGEGRKETLLQMVPTTLSKAGLIAETAL